MKLLMIGGTIFVGRHIVSEALRRGYEVTLFNRGRHNPGLFPEAEKITGDRLTDLSKLNGRRFDSIIDTCGYFPRAVRISANALKGICPHYTFISSISVYKDFGTEGCDEESATSEIKDAATEEVTGETYGPLKRLCENAAEEVYGDSALIIRPGLIVGEDDPTDRFTYWVRKVSEGSRVLIPDTPEFPVQFIDAKDLAAFTLDMAANANSGIYNATGPVKELTFEKFLSACEEASGSKPEYIRMSEEFIARHNIAPFTELPLWVPSESSGVNRTIIAKAVDAGMKLRPLKETITDTLKFDRSRQNHILRAGITADREAELIELSEAQK